MKTKFLILIAIAGIACFLSAPVVSAMDRSFSGKVVFVDPKLHAFIVQSKTGEMTFHASGATEIKIDGQPQLFGELEKGDEITVSFARTSSRPVATHVSKQKRQIRSEEMEFQGVVTAIDLKANTLTVKGNSGEMDFHVDPSARLYIGGEFKVLSELNKHEPVTVIYMKEGERHMAVDVARDHVKS